MYDIGSAVFKFYYPGLRQDFKDKMIEIMNIYTAMVNMAEYSEKVPSKLRIHIMFTNLKKSVKTSDIVGIPQNINSGMTQIQWRHLQKQKPDFCIQYTCQLLIEQVSNMNLKNSVDGV